MKQSTNKVNCQVNHCTRTSGINNECSSELVFPQGHDTTASAISWSLYSIAEHPLVQTRLQEELDGKFTGRDHDDVTWSVHILVCRPACMASWLAAGLLALQRMTLSIFNIQVFYMIFLIKHWMLIM